MDPYSTAKNDVKKIPLNQPSEFVIVQMNLKKSFICLEEDISSQLELYNYITQAYEFVLRLVKGDYQTNFDEIEFQCTKPLSNWEATKIKSFTMTQKGSDNVFTTPLKNRVVGEFNVFLHPKISIDDRKTLKLL